MTGLPTLTLQMSRAEQGGNLYRLRPMLSPMEGKRVLKAGEEGSILELPFPLEVVASIQELLNLLQSDGHFQERPFANKLCEAKLIHLGLLQATGHLPPKVHERIGMLIGSALLSNQTCKNLLSRFWDAAAEAGGGDIILVFKREALELAAIPWELAYDEQGPLLLRLPGNTPVGCTRVIDPSYGPSEPPVKQGRLRVLTVTSLVGLDASAKRLEREARNNLSEAVAKVSFDIEPVPGQVTLQQLGNRLAEPPPIQILDYFGHGKFFDGIATLEMVDAQGLQDQITARHLITLKGLPPLIVLHVCHSAQISIDRAWDSLAPKLSADANIDAVVALQGEMKMEVVTDHIVPVLYQALAENNSLPQALAKVRSALFSQGTNDVSWFIPVLYMRQFSQEPYLKRERIIAPDNPFLGPGARRDARLFVNRKKQVQEMWRFLRSGNCFSIIGPGGSGKTSMLRLLYDEEKVSAELRKPVRVIWLDIGAEKRVRQTEDYIVQSLGGKKGDRLRDILALQPLVLLIDDLGELDQERDRGAAFLNWLKTLLNMEEVQWVITSKVPLNKLHGLASSSSSSVAEQEEIHLKRFTREEARYFIRERLAHTPFTWEQFEHLLNGDEINMWDLEKACRKQYDALVEPPA